MTSDRKIWIEIDGPLHFKKDFYNYYNICIKDKTVDIIVLERKKVLIRISFDQWDKKTGFFNQICLDKIKEILANPIPGVYYLGKEYGARNIL